MWYIFRIAFVETERDESPETLPLNLYGWEEVVQENKKKSTRIEADPMRISYKAYTALASNMGVDVLLIMLKIGTAT